MTSEFVQSRLKPPILIPLRGPLTPFQVNRRIHVIKTYAEAHRELSDIEARELLELQSLRDYGDREAWKAHSRAQGGQKAIEELLA